MKNKINLVLIFALFCVSTSSIIARLLPGVSAVVIAFWRLAIASMLIWAYTSFNRQLSIDKRHYKYYMLSGFFLALHFATFYGAVKLTSIANATLLGITAPLFTIIYEKLFLKKNISPLVFLGFVIAGTGTLIITGSGLFLDDGSLLGKFLGLLAALCISLVYIIASNLRKYSNTILYTRTLYTFGAVFLLLLSFAVSDNIFAISPYQAKWLFALGVVPTILGHSLFYFSIKYTSPTIVASVPIGEPIIASLFAWIIFSESVPCATFLGGVFILVGVCLLVARSPRTQNT